MSPFNQRNDRTTSVGQEKSSAIPRSLQRKPSSGRVVDFAPPNADRCKAIPKMQLTIDAVTGNDHFPTMINGAMKVGKLYEDLPLKLVSYNIMELAPPRNIS